MIQMFTHVTHVCCVSFHILSKAASSGGPSLWRMWYTECLQSELNETSFVGHTGRKGNRKYHVAMPTRSQRSLGEIKLFLTLKSNFKKCVHLLFYFVQYLRSCGICTTDTCYRDKGGGYNHNMAGVHTQRPHSLHGCFRVFCLVSHSVFVRIRRVRLSVNVLNSCELLLDVGKTTVLNLNMALVQGLLRRPTPSPTPTTAPPPQRRSHKQCERNRRGGSSKVSGLG